MLSFRCYALRHERANSIRARVRAELTSEIKAVARRQLATEGANLSLRAVARELGMVSSAVYRYFPSRDDLLTALIIDCYNELGEAVETADAAVDRRRPARALARRRPRRPGLGAGQPGRVRADLGCPVPGYRAPQDTDRPRRPDNGRARPFPRRRLRLRRAAPRLRPDDAAPPPALETELVQALPRDRARHPHRRCCSRGLTAWIQLYGVITFELFGRLNNFIESSRREFFDHQMRVMAREIGL